MDAWLRSEIVTYLVGCWLLGWQFSKRFIRP